MLTLYKRSNIKSRIWRLGSNMATAGASTLAHFRKALHKIKTDTGNSNLFSTDATGPTPAPVPTKKNLRRSGIFSRSTADSSSDKKEKKPSTSVSNDSIKKEKNPAPPSDTVSKKDFIELLLLTESVLEHHEALINRNILLEDVIKKKQETEKKLLEQINSQIQQVQLHIPTESKKVHDELEKIVGTLSKSLKQTDSKDKKKKKSGSALTLRIKRKKSAPLMGLTSNSEYSKSLSSPEVMNFVELQKNEPTVTVVPESSPLVKSSSMFVISEEKPVPQLNAPTQRALNKRIKMDNPMKKALMNTAKLEGESRAPERGGRSRSSTIAVGVPVKITEMELLDASEKELVKIRKWRSEENLASWEMPIIYNQTKEQMYLLWEDQLSASAGEAIPEEEHKHLESSEGIPTSTEQIDGIKRKNESKLTELKNNLAFTPKQKIKGGKIEEIWEWIIFNYNFSDFQAFLIGYRKFTSAEKLIEILYEISQENFEEISSANEDFLMPFLFRLEKMVESWISDYPEDFITNQKAGNKLIQLIQFFHEIRMEQKLKLDLENEKNGVEVVYTEDDENHRLKVLLQSKINEMILKSQGNGFDDEVSNDLANSGDLAVPQAFLTCKIEFLSIPPQELAKQMCLCEFKLFKKIKNTHLFTADQRMNNVDIQNYISYINRVSNWIATEIVTTGNLKLRSSVIKYFVTLAVAFHQCRNFNALMQILCALSMACISRLKRTWKLIPKKAAGQWKELEDLFAPQGNFSKYRQLIGKTQLPCVPYFALYMKDATFTDDGNENFLEKDVVNYEKISMKYNLIAELSRYQIVGYQFTENQAIQNFLCNLTTLDEKTLYKYSCQCEPRSVDL